MKLRAPQPHDTIVGWMFGFKWFNISVQEIGRTRQGILLNDSMRRRSPERRLHFW